MPYFYPTEGPPVPCQPTNPIAGLSLVTDHAICASGLTTTFSGLAPNPDPSDRLCSGQIVPSRNLQPQEHFLFAQYSDRVPEAIIAAAIARNGEINVRGRPDGPQMVGADVALSPIFKWPSTSSVEVSLPHAVTWN